MDSELRSWVVLQEGGLGELTLRQVPKGVLQLEKTPERNLIKRLNAHTHPVVLFFGQTAEAGGISVLRLQVHFETCQLTAFQSLLRI